MASEVDVGRIPSACRRSRPYSGSAESILGQTLIDFLIQRTAFGPIAHKPRAIPGIRRGETAERTVLAHRVEVDQRPAILLPEQVMPLEVAMADA